MVDAGAGISFHAGLRDGDDHGDIALEQYIYSTRPSGGGRMHTGATGYRIDGTDHVRTGDRVRIHGMPYCVMDAVTVFEQRACGAAATYSRRSVSVYPGYRQGRWRARS